MSARRGPLTGAAVLAAVTGAMAWSAVAGPSAPTIRPAVFGGSLVLADDRPLTVIDLATASVTVRLQDVDSRVGAANYGDVQPVPVAGGTFLVNRSTGTFNFLDPDNYVVDAAGPGVALGPLRGLSGAEGLAAGSGAWILRSAADSTATLVDRGAVAAAASGRPAVLPGYAAVGGRVELRSGSAVVSGADLWVLVDRLDGCRLERIGSQGAYKMGATGAPCARSALEAVAGGVAWALPGRIRFFAPAERASIALRSLRGDTRFVPVTGAGSEAWFLCRGRRAWSLVGWRPAGAVTGPFDLARLDPSSDPAPPAVAGGLLYTFDRHGTGQPPLWAVNLDGGRMTPVDGAPAYPRRSAAEEDSFAAGEVMADGPRVVFNNPQSLEALVVFTDGSHRPVVVDKSQAVTVSTVGPADLDVTAAAPSRAPSRAPAPPPVPPVQPVSPEVACADTTQKPYAPAVTSVVPSSGGALVTWSYQLLDPTDCEPGSWAVQVVDVSGGPQPSPGVRVVEGQQQILFTGLRPATTYRVTVSAYINSQSTPSAPVAFTTAARGPDAPLSVTTTADGQGDWIVSWVPCTEAFDARCVVPADRWSVIGSACGGSYVGLPPTVSVPGGQHRVLIRGDPLGLLGDSLTFSVEGFLGSGLAGDPASDHSCTEAWRPADPSAIQLTAETAPSAGTVTATLRVDTTGDPVEAFGALPGRTDFLYRVGERTVGPTTRPEATFAGLDPGLQYVPTVAVYPAGHPGAEVTVAGEPFSQTLAWPVDLEAGTTVTASVGPDPNEGSIDLAFPSDLPSGPLSATQAELVCGSTAVAEPDQPVSSGRVGYPVDLVHYGGRCSISLTLADAADPDPYGGPSPELTAPFAIGTQPGYTFDASVAGDCTHAYRCGPLGEPWQVEVRYTGTGPLGAGGDWSISAALDSSGPRSADPCATAEQLPGPAFPALVELPASCPDVSRARITVSYTYLGRVLHADAGNPAGAPPPATLPPAPTTTTTTTTTPCSTTTTSPSSTTTTTRPASTTTTTVVPATTTTTARVASFGSASTTPGPCGVSAAELAADSRHGPPLGAGWAWALVALGSVGLSLLVRRKS